MDDPFQEVPNSFLSAVFKAGRTRPDISHPDPNVLNNLSSISALYLYANPPPNAYGTPAPKIAETVLRSYDFNKKDEGKTIQIDGYRVDNPVWENKGDFPFGEVHSNWHPGEMYKMTTNFYKQNKTHIKEIADLVMESALTTNSDILTKGNQTWDPITERSLPSAQAYSEYCELLIDNGFPNHHSLIGLIKYTFELMEKPTIIGKKVKWKYEEKVKSVNGQRVTTRKKVQYIVRKQYDGEAAYRYVMNIIRSFCGYNKSGERAHLKRRAIASPSIPMRAFLYIVEDFHLKLGKRIKGSTISIGGDEKKMKIIETMNSAAVDPIAERTLQATQDATKWNECLSAGGFGMMSKTLFCDEVRDIDDKMNENEKLFGEICEASHFFLSLKRIILGEGLQGKADGIHGKMEYNEENLPKFNQITQEWLRKALPYLEDNAYLSASSGMLMGMHNAASTTLGLISVGHRKGEDSNIYTLRSSDDSMTLYAAPNMKKMNILVDTEDLNLQLCGINLSKKKTFIFKFGYGEYTSWYQDGKMVAQYGPETTTLRPGGNNPPDDFNNLARTTSVSLMKLETNEIGAEAKLRLGVQNIRSLYLIKPKSRDATNISRKCLVLSDGGLNLWNCSNCHLEETCLKEYFAETQEEKEYFLRIRNPENPFSTEPKEEITWSKDAGTLTIGYAETPRTVFHYVKRTNRTVRNKKGPTQADEEKANAEAMGLLTMADISTLVKIPSGSHNMADHMVSCLRTVSSGMDMSTDEQQLMEEALTFLKEGVKLPEMEETVDIDLIE
uniref:RNA-directed RNA polymerase catalytic subunit n=1 Tax=Wuhan Louse Fly Virus 4 TaxID=1608118 RepID=A0A0B5KJZ7_9ORTO|nr:PB1 [Wuhan Louse Fly Virus 4]